MRWFPKARTGPRSGDRRDRAGILLWPRTDTTTGQRRWLSWSRWTEQYTYWMPGEDGPWYRWQVVEWLN